MECSGCGSSPPNKKEISHGGCRGNYTELVSKWGRWLHRLGRPIIYSKAHQCIPSVLVMHQDQQYVCGDSDFARQRFGINFFACQILTANKEFHPVSSHLGYCLQFWIVRVELRSVMFVVQNTIDCGSMKKHRKLGIGKRRADGGKRVKLGCRHVDNRKELRWPRCRASGVEDGAVRSFFSGRQCHIRDGYITVCTFDRL